MEQRFGLSTSVIMLGAVGSLLLLVPMASSSADSGEHSESVRECGSRAQRLAGVALDVVGFSECIATDFVDSVSQRLNEFRVFGRVFPVNPETLVIRAECRRESRIDAIARCEIDYCLGSSRKWLGMSLVLKEAQDCISGRLVGLRRQMDSDLRELRAQDDLRKREEAIRQRKEEEKREQAVARERRAQFFKEQEALYRTRFDRVKEDAWKFFNSDAVAVSMSLDVIKLVHDDPAFPLEEPLDMIEKLVPKLENLLVELSDENIALEDLRLTCAQQHGDRFVAKNALVADCGHRLVWTTRDNGRDISWGNARRHCETRGDPWRVPILPELRTLYDPEGPQSLLKPATELIGFSGSHFWSAVGNAGARFEFVGGRLGTSTSESTGTRVRCVRPL